MLADKRSARISDHRMTAQFARPRRSFLFIGITAKHIANAEYCRRIAENGHKFQYVHRHHAPPFVDSPKGFYVIGGSQSLRRGPTAYHLWDGKHLSKNIIAQRFGNANKKAVREGILADSFSFYSVSFILIHAADDEIERHIG